MVSQDSHLADDYSLSRVPQEARVPMWGLLLIRVGGLTALSAFMMGATLGYGMTYWQAMLATALGTLILEVISLLLGIAAAREGMSLSLLSRWAGFGKYGSSLIGLVIAISLVGWFGIQNSVFAEGLDGAFGHVLGFKLAAIITGLAVTLIVVFGLKWMSWTAKITVPLFFIVIAFSIVKILQTHSLGDLMTSPAPGAKLTLGVATTMVAGGYIAGALITPDISRYCKSSKDVLWMTLIGTFLGELGVNTLAVWMAHALKSPDIENIMLQTAGWVGAAIVIFATVKVNDLNLYSSSLGITNAFDSLFKIKVNRGLMTLIIGVIGTVLSVFGILGQFQQFLIFLGVWLPPVGGIMVVDYFVLKRSRKILTETRLLGIIPATCEALNPVTIVAWVVGFLVGYFYHAGLPSLNALIASGIVYYVGMLVYSVVGVSKKEEASI